MLQAQDGLTRESKYVYMSDNGGAARWWGIPMITIAGHISQAQLNRIEKAEYTREARPLNMAGLKGKKSTLRNGSGRTARRGANQWG